VLSVDNLTKQFGGFTAVNAISFQLAKGEILGLIGPNGSGKSTTFSLIAGLLAPTSGSVSLDGLRISHLPPNAICQLGVGRTFQIPRPFRKLSVLDNVTLAAYFGTSEHISRPVAEQRAHEALALIDLPASSATRVDRLGVAGLKKL